ncbi:MAG TPA: hypothetical protein VJP85_01375 [Candidatus Baltobacteraceae bacterium]|nr:hypothetical protein [Candidatus Baltobacteraceae bacterium]
MLELVRTLVLGATAGTLFAAVLGSLPIRQGSRLALGAGIGAWISLAVAIAASGATRNTPLAVPVMFALPLIAAGLAATSAASRRAMMAIPVNLIVALSAIRVVGVLMLIAAATGLMYGPFPYFAGIGDIITAIFALPVARLALRNPRDIRVLEWNIFGALDLVVAVALGVASARTGSAAMTTLPWALIPLVLVPTYLIGHALVFAHMREAAPVGSRAQTTAAQA